MPQLIYTKNGEPVHTGDRVQLSDKEWVEITYFTIPHKPSSQGKVTVRPVDDPQAYDQEYYVSVIGAEWINREDQS